MDKRIKADTQTIGKKLKALRLETGLTQLEMAARLNISQSHLARIEGGRVKKLGMGLFGKLWKMLGYEKQNKMIMDAKARKPMVKQGRHPVPAVQEMSDKALNKLIKDLVRVEKQDNYTRDSRFLAELKAERDKRMEEHNEL